jgi:glycerol-3-phosphate dehydrogenase (NAD(P)+)
MSILVLGAGAFGTALAISLASAEKDVTLWAHDPEHVGEMAASRRNDKRLPGAAFPHTLRLTAALNRPTEWSAILIALPMQQLATFVDRNKHALNRAPLIACCKGVDLESGARPSQILNRAAPMSRIAALTGPSFAVDISAGQPTALTLACTNDRLGTKLQEQLSTPTLRLYRTTDVIGAELGGALKNVMAIACGAAIGAGLGNSARAALITRGFAEMRRLARATGARDDTLAGLSGFGDLVLTCTSDTSRNYRYGLALGSGQTFDPTTTVEGAATAQACAETAQRHNIDMPITDAVVDLMTGETSVHEVMTTLLARPLKEETCS